MENRKICFVTIRNIFNTACLPRYKKLINGQFDIIYWDQHGIDEDCGADNHYVLKYKVPYGKKKILKVIGYLKFLRFATRILKENKYDALIILPTQTGFILHNFLSKNYYKKYILDIRDYSGEKKKFIYRIVKRLVANAGLNVITSPAYKTFLPEAKYLISHNITKVNKDLIEKYRKENLTKNRDKIIISCIGSIRFIEQFKKVINSFANDKRFELRFIGRGSEKLKKYCIDNSINNVVLKGRFDSSETIEYYLETDIILNLYGNNSPYLDYALSNKLYYAATLGMPIIVSPNTYMEEVTVNSGFGFAFDIEDSASREKLYKYYNSIDWEKFYDNCDNFMQKVMRDEQIFSDNVKKFLDGK